MLYGLLTICEQENGVATAIQAIYRDLEYARTLIKARTAANTAQGNFFGDDGAGEVEEDTWTWIGDESDPDLVRRIQDRDLSRAARVSMELSQAGIRATQAVERVGKKSSSKK